MFIVSKRRTGGESARRAQRRVPTGVPAASRSQALLTASRFPASVGTCI
jgi:hypothetical protein